MAMSRLGIQKGNGMRKGLGILALVMVLAVSGCMAEEAMQVTVSCRILESARLSETGLSAANQVLNRLKLRQVAGEEAERAELMIDGRMMWSVTQQEKADGVHTVFSDMTDYVTEKDAPDALMLLVGTEGQQKNPCFSPKAYSAFAPELYEMLGDMDEPSTLDYTVTVEHAAYSPKYDRYVLPQAAINAGWRQVAAAAWRHFYPDGGDEEAFAALCDVTFSGDVQVKRLYDRQGADLGVQLTGNGHVLGEERKISLTLGYTEGKGGSLLLSLKALKGNDALRVNATLKESIKEQRNAYTFSCTFLNQQGKEKETWALNAALQETPEGENRRIGGEMKWEKDGVTYLIQPDLLQGVGSVSGTVQLAKKEKKQQTLQALFTVEASPAEEPVLAEHVQQIALSHLEAEEARLQLFPENVVLMRAVTYLLDDLEEGQRWQLTHDLKNENWLNGPEVPVQEEKQELWMIEEETP